MELVNELVMYIIKYVALGLIAFAGIMCGIKYKKDKLAKEAAADTADKEAE